MAIQEIIRTAAGKFPQRACSPLQDGRLLGEKFKSDGVRLRQHRSCKVVEITKVPPTFRLSGFRKISLEISRINVALHFRQHISKLKTIFARANNPSAYRLPSVLRSLEILWGFIDTKEFSNEILSPARSICRAGC